MGSEEPEDPLVSPIRGDYQGLPPLYVQVSDSEMLLDDSLRLARRCQIYNVYAKLDIWRKIYGLAECLLSAPNVDIANRFALKWCDVGLILHETDCRNGAGCRG